MTCNLRTFCRAALVTCVAVVSIAASPAPPPAARAAGASTWYWQNPLPRDYGISAVACRSATACVAVGGSIVTTVDGGIHWTEQRSGTPAYLDRIACPDGSACYAVGTVGGSFTQNARVVILKSVDGGTTWQRVSTHLSISPYTFISSMACPGVATCLLGGANASLQGNDAILRTVDGATTWRLVHIKGLKEIDAIACPTGTICYALGRFQSGMRFLWSGDGGQTWQPRGSQNPTGLYAMACPGADTCFATAVDCGGECNLGHIYVTRDGGRTWKRVANGATGYIACPSVTTCYASGDQSVLSTSNGGQTWAIHRVPSQPDGLTCPGPTTCYAPTLFGMLRTSDGFGHSEETLSHSSVQNQTLTEISCPNSDSCYIAGSRNACPSNGPCDQVPASFAATTDGGSTWRTTPKTLNLLERVSCPSAGVCFAIGGTDPGPIALDRTNDGARTWHQIGWQAISTRLLANNQAADVACVGGTTCYVLATVAGSQPGSNGFTRRVAVLVTHDLGKTWSIQTGIDIAARTESSGPPNRLMMVAPSRISCPSIMACFVLATIYTPGAAGNGKEQVVLLSTSDGGATWTRHLTVPGTVPDTGYAPLGQDLSCPTTSTCYLLSFLQNPQAGNPNGVPGPVLITHDAGVTWSRSVVSKGAYLTAISCATGQNCRVSGDSGMFSTEDGGVTWQRELLSDGSQIPPMASIACPAVDTCYSVGGPEPCCAVMILATHPPGVVRPVVPRVIRRGELHRPPQFLAYRAAAP